MKYPALLVSLACLALQSSRALEPWVDEKLSVKDGMEMWFDATRQPAAREARKMPTPGRRKPRIPSLRTRVRTH
jgi:hypothetical protein